MNGEPAKTYKVADINLAVSSEARIKIANSDDEQ